MFNNVFHIKFFAVYKIEMSLKGQHSNNLTRKKKEFNLNG